jgi:hypothetical protein
VSKDDSLLNLSTPNRIITVNRDLIKFGSENRFNISIQYEASSKPKFTLYGNKDQVIFYDFEIADDYLYGYEVKISPNEFVLIFEHLKFTDIGNYTLNAKIIDESENISVELIVEGKISCSVREQNFDFFSSIRETTNIHLAFFR